MTRAAVCFALLLVGCAISSPEEALDGAVEPEADRRRCPRLDAGCDAGASQLDAGARDARSSSDAPSTETSTSTSTSTSTGQDAQGLDAQGHDAQRPDGQIGDARALDATGPDSAAPTAADAQRPETGIAQPAEWRGTLISWLGQDESAFITKPHQIELISVETGLPLQPPITTTTGVDGKFRLQVPASRPTWLHVLGQGSVTDPNSTYDSLTLWVPESGDRLVRITTLGTAATAETTGNFVAKTDHAPVQGVVYRVDVTGRRIGMVGCAKIFLDDLPSPALGADQRYIEGVLPTTLDKQAQTQRKGGWYFGNIAPGLHTFKASVDEGQSFLAQTTVYIPLARKDASGPSKFVAVLLGIDVPGPDPTPASCTED